MAKTDKAKSGKQKADKAAGKVEKKTGGKKTTAASIDQAKAGVGVAKGKVEKAAGTVSGKKKLKAKGQADETGAKAYGKAAKARKKLAK